MTAWEHHCHLYLTSLNLQRTLKGRRRRKKFHSSKETFPLQIQTLSLFLFLMMMCDLTAAHSLKMISLSRLSMLDSPRTMTRTIFEEDDDRHNKEPEDEDQVNPPSPPEFTVMPSSPPTMSPTFIPTSNPTIVPTTSPTSSFTKKPSSRPTLSPSTSPPTARPTNVPTSSPSDIYTSFPSRAPTLSPTQAPTSNPTKVPLTSSPIMVPTVASTIHPTSKPTNNPTSQTGSITPTSSPTITHQPSDSPVAAPTEQPSYLPLTIQPSASPTVSPIKSITEQPSNPPTLFPTVSSTFSPTCDINQLNGEFGTISSNVNIVAFYYQIESEPNPSESVEDNILPDVEIAIANLLIRYFFGSCPNNRSNIRKLANIRKLEDIVGGTVVGVSSKPNDVIISDSCEPNTTHPCHLFEGRLSIYMEEPSSDIARSDTNKMVLDKIERGMDSGALNSAHEDVIQIKYMTNINELSDDAIIDNENQGDDNLADDTSVLNTNYLAGLIIGALIISSSICFARYFNGRKRSIPIEDNEDDEDFDSNWGEVVTERNLSSQHVSSDDETIHRSNNKLSARNIVDPDDLEVNVNLESFEPRTPEKKDGCFDFFDLILEGTSMSKRIKPNAIDHDEHSHLSELSF
mmetsp:Transcript_6593/g.8358  ORF Transcript_6593/g.8358 Transcript_6593/m.8358 type:complete len:628 (-) Transcript_6593:326-2209(-)